MKIGLCIPVYDGRMHDATAVSLSRTMTQAAAMGIEIRLFLARGLGVLPHVRNWLVAQALHAGCDKVWFVDSDIAWDRCIDETLNMLLAPVDVVAGVPQARNIMWNDPARLVVRWDKLPPEIDPETGLYRVLKVATAFMCVDRSVFERIDAAGLARRYTAFGDPSPDPAMAHLRAWFWYDFIPATWLTPDLRGRCIAAGLPDDLTVMQGEDYYFCDRVKDVGGKVYVDPRIKLTHYDGCVQHTASLADVQFVSAWQDEAA